MSVQSEISRIEQNVANTYAVLEALGADMPSEQNSDNLAPTAESAKVVLYKPQTLTEAEKAQARENIGAIGKNGLSLGVKDGLIYLYVDGEAVGNGIEQSVSGDVVGYVDEDNNIILRGDLADGTYHVRYELADGEILDIGELSFVPEGPTNWADPTSADWVTGKRLSSSSGSVSTAVEGHIITNFIPAKMGDVLRVKGLDITQYLNGYSTGVWAYKTDKSYQNFGYGYYEYQTNSDGIKDVLTVDGDITTYTILMKKGGTQFATSDTGYIRIDGALLDGYTANDVIITINEEIV